MSRWQGILGGLGALVVGSVIIVGLALLYFIVTAWIVAFGVNIVVGREPSPEFVALSASILTIGGLAGSTYRSVASSYGGGRAAEDEDYGGQEVA